MKNGDRPAFLEAAIGETEDNYVMSCGLTKREHFAGLAMQGLLAGGMMSGDGRLSKERVCELSVKISDALLAELDK